MRKLPYVVLCTAVLFAFTEIASAHGAGGSARFGGPAVGSRAAANSNGRFASDRDHGLARAEDRRDIRQDKHERRADKREMKRDLKKTNFKDARRERKEMRGETRDIRKDRRDLRADRADRGEDRR